MALLSIVAAVVIWTVVVPGWRPSLEAEERYGVDVSSHQGHIDWSAVARDDIEFAYKPQDEKGGLGGEVKFGWNPKKTEVR